MAGGNDGLNTVVPYANDYYHKARPRIGAGTQDASSRSTTKSACIRVLAGFKDLYDAGHLSIIQGIGYPNPNRSHFRSTEIWQTASDAEKFESYGWIGRYFDNACGGADPTVGVNIGRQMPQAFRRQTRPASAWTTRKATASCAGAANGPAGEMNADEKSFRGTQPVREDDADNSGATMGAVSGPTAHRGSAHRFSGAHRLGRASQFRQDTGHHAGEFRTRPTYPASQLANSLKLVAKLIGGGLSTRVFYVSQGGYDTHTNQTGQHERLLQETGRFRQGVCRRSEGAGQLQRVLLMTFSEFGRRVAENANGGTDHGAAAPMFVVGPRSRRDCMGVIRAWPRRTWSTGDIAYNVDFRSVYAGVLEEWLRTKSEPILGRRFEPLALV